MKEFFFPFIYFLYVHIVESRLLYCSKINTNLQSFKNNNIRQQSPLQLPNDTIASFTTDASFVKKPSLVVSSCVKIYNAVTIATRPNNNSTERNDWIDVGSSILFLLLTQNSRLAFSKY